MIYHYDDYEFIFIVHKQLDKNRFLAAAGARRGYAVDMFSRMYDALMGDSIDLVEEFERYYKIEYEDLGRFLYRKWNLSYKAVSEIIKFLKGDPNLTLKRRLESSYHGTQLRTFMSEDPMVDRIEKILLMK